MFWKVLRGLALAALMAVAAPAAASFRASDLLYVPAVSHTSGSAGSEWRTDLYITNVDDVDIDVMMVYLPSGPRNNAPLLRDRTQWLGGRDSDGFGFVDERLADIPPKGTVVIRDPVGEYWAGILGLAGNGAMIVFASEAGSLDPDGNRVYSNAIVYARIYNEAQIWEQDSADQTVFNQVDTTYGQVMPGVPWYDLGDPAVVDLPTDPDVPPAYDFSVEMLQGAQEDDAYRFNLGILNASDPQTQITVEIRPYHADGTVFTDENDNTVRLVVAVPPLNHLQYFQILRNVLGIDEAEDLSEVLVRVKVLSWDTNNPDAIVAFTSYGSVIDNVSNDPTTLLPSFLDPYDVDCVWAFGDKAAGTAPRGTRLGRRPVEIPPAR